jgi:hypothetical protein
MVMRRWPIEKPLFCVFLLFSKVRSVSTSFVTSNFPDSTQGVQSGYSWGPVFASSEGPHVRTLHGEGDSGGGDRRLGTLSAMRPVRSVPCSSYAVAHNCATA